MPREKYKPTNRGSSGFNEEKERGTQAIYRITTILDVKYEEQKTQLSKLEAKVKSLCSDMNDKEMTINQLKERLKLAEAYFLSNKSDINALEQYGRREMINFSGIPRTNNEDTDEIVFNITDKQTKQTNKK